MSRYSTVMDVSTSLRSSRGIVVSVIRRIRRNGSVVCNIHGRHGASAFFGQFATRTFCGLVRDISGSAICGRTSFHVVAGHALGTLVRCSRHGLFLETVIHRLKFHRKFICCSHGTHRTNRDGCPLAGVLDFDVSNVASFSITPLGFVAFLNLTVALMTFVVVVFTLIRRFRNGAVRN